jgi:hypothetical protein
MQKTAARPVSRRGCGARVRFAVPPTGLRRAAEGRLRRAGVARTLGL